MNSPTVVTGRIAADRAANHANKWSSQSVETTAAVSRCVPTDDAVGYRQPPAVKAADSAAAIAGGIVADRAVADRQHDCKSSNARCTLRCPIAIDRARFNSRHVSGGKNP